MKTSKLILTLSTIVLIIAVVMLVVTLNKYGVLTGRATDKGTANLTISAAASISFSDAVCDFGAGSVNETPTFANIYTGNGTCINGSWTGNACDGLEITNDGNVNLTVTLASSGDKDAFIGGTSPSFQWNVTDGTDCVGVEGITSLTEITGTPNACTNLTQAGTLTIDFALTIPEDAEGTKGTVITATGTAVA